MARECFTFSRWRKSENFKIRLGSGCFLISSKRKSEISQNSLSKRMLYYVYIYKNREFNAMSLLKNALLFLHRENQRIQHDFSVRKSLLFLHSENQRIQQEFSVSMLYFFSIEKNREFKEMSRL